MRSSDSLGETEKMVRLVIALAAAGMIAVGYLVLQPFSIGAGVPWLIARLRTRGRTAWSSAPTCAWVREPSLRPYPRSSSSLEAFSPAGRSPTPAESPSE